MVSLSRTVDTPYGVVTLYAQDYYRCGVGCEGVVINGVEHKSDYSPLYVPLEGLTVDGRSHWSVPLRRSEYKYQRTHGSILSRGDDQASESARKKFAAVLYPLVNDFMTIEVRTAAEVTRRRAEQRQHDDKIARLREEIEQYEQRKVALDDEITEIGEIGFLAHRDAKDERERAALERRQAEDHERWLALRERQRAAAG